MDKRSRYIFAGMVLFAVAIGLVWLATYKSINILMLPAILLVIFGGRMIIASRRVGQK